MRSELQLTNGWFKKNGKMSLKGLIHQSGIYFVKTNMLKYDVFCHL